MTAKLVLAGSHATLVEWVRRRLLAAFGARLEVHDATSIAPSPLCWVLLDRDAPHPPTPATRVVDWSLLGANVLAGAPDEQEIAHRLAAADEALDARVAILRALLDVPAGPPATEFHASLRVADLPRSVAFYAWLLDIWPREWTARYATFLRSDLRLNFVLMVADGKTLHHDTLYHVGVAQADRQAVIVTYHRALAAGVRVVKPPRTTWRGTPLHELWLEDPDGTLVEIYARLSAAELARMPPDQEPEYLVPGTAP